MHAAAGFLPLVGHPIDDPRICSVGREPGRRRRRGRARSPGCGRAGVRVVRFFSIRGRRRRAYLRLRGIIRGEGTNLPQQLRAPGGGVANGLQVPGLAGEQVAVPADHSVLHRRP